MNKKANEQYKNNEKTILDVFTRLLEEKDLQKITVKEIVKMRILIVLLSIIILKMCMVY